MSAYVTPAIALVAAVAAVASLLISLHSSRRSDRDSAREEALALAEVRGEMLKELRADHELRIRALEAALTELLGILERQLDETSATTEQLPTVRSVTSRPSGRRTSPPTSAAS